MLHAHCALLVGTTILVLVAALPVKVPTPAPPAPELNSTETNLLYDRYLQEVVNTLETDPEFREKLGKADAESIRNGDIAHHLEFVSHHVRTKLDEIKRIEMDRLRSYVEEQYRMQNNIDEDHLKIAEHIDHENPHTFEIADLKKLILKTTSDLAEADKLRREEFKHYELQKEFEKQEELRHLNEQERIKKQEELKQLEEQHNKHEKIHYPGNKAQLEEVWEKQDHMDPEDFDPKTFFMIHDVDSNGFWDENEVKALFIKELDKMYETGHKEDDPKEREEEMERMREQVFNSADLNKDNLISLEEFLLETRQNEFKEDPNWNTVDNTPQFTHEEYLAYEREQQEHVKKLIAEGKLPPHANMPYGSYDGSNDINHGQPGQQQPPHYQQQQQQQQYQQQQQHDYQQQQYQQQQLNNQHAINQQQPPAVQQQQQQQPPQVVQQQPHVVQQQQQPQVVQQQQQPQVVQQQQQPQVVQQQQQPQVVQQQQQPQVVQQQQQPQVVQQQQQQQQQPPVVQQQQQQFQQPPPVVQQQQNPPPAAPAQPKPVPQKQPPPPSANHV